MSMQKVEDQFLIKQSLKEKREMEIELQKEINLRLKSQLRENIENNKEQKMRKIREEAQLIKEQKKVNHQDFRLSPHNHPREKVFIYVVLAVFMGVALGWFFSDQFISVLAFTP